ncbi:MAG: sigma factor [Pseudomonadota bacterium]
MDRVFRTVRPMFQDEAEAEDVCRDALIKALSSLDRYQPRPGSSFVSWVVAIGYNTARHRFRRRRPVPTDPDSLAALQASLVAEGDPSEGLHRR